MIRIPACLACLVALSLAVPALAEGDDHHLSEAEGLRIQHAWGVETAGGVQVYMEIENNRDDTVTLTGGATEDGAELVLMATEVSAQGGTVAIGEIPITGGSEMDLAPGGLYLWLDEAGDVAVGDLVAAHVALNPVGEVEIEIEIMAPGTRQHPHAGHNH